MAFNKIFKSYKMNEMNKSTSYELFHTTQVLQFMNMSGISLFLNENILIEKYLNFFSSPRHFSQPEYGGLRTQI